MDRNNIRMSWYFSCTHDFDAMFSNLQSEFNEYSIIDRFYHVSDRLQKWVIHQSMTPKINARCPVPIIFYPIDLCATLIAVGGPKTKMIFKGYKGKATKEKMQWASRIIF